MNNGLSDTLKAAFPKIIPVSREIIPISCINPYWLAGFTLFFPFFLINNFFIWYID